MHVYLCYAYVTLASARYHDNVDSIRLRYWMYIDYCDCTVKLYYCIFLFFTHTLRVCIFVSDRLRYDTIRYDSVYLTCSKKLTGSQLSPPHGTNKQKLKCETKNKTMSMIGPVQSRCHEGSPVGKRNLRWEGLVEKVGFVPGVKEWRSDGWHTHTHIRLLNKRLTDRNLNNKIVNIVVTAES